MWRIAEKTRAKDSREIAEKLAEKTIAERLKMVERLAEKNIEKEKGQQRSLLRRR